VIADVDEASSKKVIAQVERAGSEGIFVKTDVRKKADAQNVVKSAVEKFGRLDILVNIAGIGLYAPIEDMLEEDFDRVLAVHVKGTFLCSQTAIQEMKKNQWGRIVNITSRAAYKGRPGMGVYAAAKGAILAMSRVMAVEVAPYGINVNCVVPGTAETKMAMAMFTTPEARAEEAAFTGVVTRPIRLAYPEEIAAAIMFLCSTPSAHITGSTIHVNGGTYMP
jgi:NAD(P)-dependent dehydrogenase (short-subunit alcohol dehydrogenase family)